MTLFMDHSDKNDHFDITEYLTIDYDPTIKDELFLCTDSVSDTTTTIATSSELLLPIYTPDDHIYMPSFEYAKEPLDYAQTDSFEYAQTDSYGFNDLFIETDQVITIDCQQVENPTSTVECNPTEFEFPDQDKIEELSKTMDGDDLIKELWSPEMYGRKYEKGRNWYCCHICQKLFTRSVNLKSHVVADHWKLRPIKCPVKSCTARFARKHDCKRHVRLVHPQEED